MYGYNTVEAEPAKPICRQLCAVISALQTVVRGI